MTEAKFHSGARSLARASASDVVFCKAVTPLLVSALRESAARVVVTTSEVYDVVGANGIGGKAFVITSRPRTVIAALTMPLASSTQWAHPSAPPNDTVVIATGASIAPGVVFGEHVSVAAGAVIGPNTVLTHVSVGEDTVIGSNCSIGGDGFGFETDPKTGAVYKVPHFGRVTIGSRVEIFSNVCVARGSFDDTVIEDDVKIDNLVHIAHNCRIGRGSFVIANAMIAGSVTVGDGAWIAPSTSVLNGTSVGRLAMTGLGSVVVKPVEENTLVAGVPAKALRPRYSPPPGSS